MIQIDGNLALEERDFDMMLGSCIYPHLDSYMSQAFSRMFNQYLEENYGIDEEQFKRILKNLAPEEFI